MGIDIDVTDDEQYAVLRALVPYTIHAEATGADGEELYVAHDSGAGFQVALNEAQLARLHGFMSEHALSLDLLTSVPTRRRWWHRGGS